MIFFDKKVVRGFLALGLLLHLSSCSGSINNVEPEIFSNEGLVRRAEVRDHNFCTDRSKDIEEQYTAHEVYWKCRLQFTDSRKSNDREYNKKVKKVRKEIKKKLNALEESNLQITTSEIEDQEHKECLIKGYTLDTESVEMKEKYYKCRAKLAKKRDGYLILGERSYFDDMEVTRLNSDIIEYRSQNGVIEEFFVNDDVNKVDEVDKIEKESLSTAKKDSFALHKFLITDASKKTSLRKKYPKCSKYGVKTSKFSFCKKAYDNNRQCTNSIDEKTTQKSLEDKINCEKTSMEKYPDTLISYKDDEDVGFVSGPKMSRIELKEKRQEYIQQCSEKNKVDMEEYKANLKKECSDFISDWK